MKEHSSSLELIAFLQTLFFLNSNNTDHVRHDYYQISPLLVKFVHSKSYRLEEFVVYIQNFLKQKINEFNRNFWNLIKCRFSNLLQINPKTQ